jgi:hypothetical protein
VRNRQSIQAVRVNQAARFVFDVGKGRFGISLILVIMPGQGRENIVHRVKQAGGAQFVDPRQVPARFQPEVRKEAGRRGIDRGPPRHLAPAGDAIQPASSSTSSVPRDVCTPRIASISARLTGS